MERQEWMSPQKYAKHQNLPYSTVLRLIRAGTIPAIALGHNYKVNVRFADAYFLEQQKLPKKNDQKTKKEFDVMGKKANADVKAAGGFQAALLELARQKRA